MEAGRAGRSESGGPTGAPVATCAVILAGGLRPSRLIEATGRATLDLWIDRERRVLDCWLERLGEILGPSARVLVVPSASCPAPILHDDRAELVQEERDFRGPAGVVRDVVGEFIGSVVVVEAARLLTCSLRGMLDAHGGNGAWITVARQHDESPSGIYMMRAEALEMVPARGFMDLKEQLLGKIGDRVGVVDLPGAGALPLRTRRQFLDASAYLRSAGSAGDATTSVWWTPDAHSRGTISARAEVHESASILDSVVMPGARIGRGSLVARSIICEGAEVRPGARVVDSVATHAGVSIDARASEMRAPRGVRALR